MISIRKSFQPPSTDKPFLIINNDVKKALAKIPDETFQTVVTSPPYWGVRDYGYEGQIGAEPTVKEYVQTLVEVFREVRRTLKPDGTMWLNIANCYTSGGRKWRQSDKKNKGRAMSYRPDTPEGLKKKDLIGVAWMLAMELQIDGWYLRNDIIWNKPNGQPESVKDRLTVTHEYLFLLSKSEKYKFNQDAIREDAVVGGTKRKRTVWSINTEPFPDAHYAVFPQKLVEPCILAGSDPDDLILDPFLGTGTVSEVAGKLGRKAVGIELKEDFVQMAKKRLAAMQTEMAL